MNRHVETLVNFKVRRAGKDTPLTVVLYHTNQKVTIQGKGFLLLTDSFLEPILKGNIQSNAYSIKDFNKSLMEASKDLKNSRNNTNSTNLEQSKKRKRTDKPHKSVQWSECPKELLMLLENVTLEAIEYNPEVENISPGINHDSLEI